MVVSNINAHVLQLVFNVCFIVDLEHQLIQ